MTAPRAPPFPSFSPPALDPLPSQPGVGINYRMTVHSLAFHDAHIVGMVRPYSGPGPKID